VELEFYTSFTQNEQLVLPTSVYMFMSRRYA
jgi:hypothetical protein